MPGVISERKVYQPLPYAMACIEMKTKTELDKITGIMVKKAMFNTRDSVGLMVSRSKQIAGSLRKDVI